MTPACIAVNEAIHHTSMMLGPLTEREREIATKAATLAVRWTKRLLADDLAEAIKND